MSEQHTVTVFVQPPSVDCRQCDMTKKIMDKEGIEYDVKIFTEEDVVRFKAGIDVQGTHTVLMSAPVVILGDLDNPTAAWAGFQPHNIKEIKNV